MSFETPDYEVERRIGAVEIRRYQPYVVAETDVRGSLERAGTCAFRRHPLGRPGSASATSWCRLVPIRARWAGGP